MIKNNKKLNTTKKLFKILLTIIFFPFAHIVNVFRSGKGKLYKLFHSLLSIFIALPIWVILVVIIGYFVLLEGGLPLNYFQIVGDSMLPTLTNNTILFTYPTKTWFKTYVPQRGDIVMVTNAKTTHDGKETDYVKRVIAIGGDILRMDDGNVYLNGKLLHEPYLLNADSTWPQNTFCGEYKIPKGKVFLMGDNRLFSTDSRQLGVFANTDIVAYIPFAKQDSYKKNWVSNDSSITLDTHEFIKLINDKRQQVGVPALTENSQLDEATSKRASVIFQYNDTSYSATRSGYTTLSAIGDVGFKEYGPYRDFSLINVQLRADRLEDYFMTRSDLKEYMLNRMYVSIGVTLNKGKLDNCNSDITEFVLFGKK